VARFLWFTVYIDSLLCLDCRIVGAMSSVHDTHSKVITASCTLLAASQMADGTTSLAPAAVQAITLHTSSQKIVVPVASVCAAADKESSDGARLAGSSDTVSTTNASLLASSGEKHTEAVAPAPDASHKPAPQKTGSTTLVTRRVRFQAKPNISKNARTR